MTLTRLRYSMSHSTTSLFNISRWADCWQLRVTWRRDSGLDIWMLPVSDLPIFHLREVLGSASSEGLIFQPPWRLDP